MHMSDALLSATVGVTMTAASAGAIGHSIRKITKFEMDEKKIPMMGVMGAFVFAAQMINFTIPVTGSSGHIGGGILLAALLGPYHALITIASVLLIQCLFFADGGLLALGCNIFNMGVLPCLVAYPLIFRPIVRKAMTKKRITAASVLAVVIGLQVGSLAVVLQTQASGITELPFLSFVALMQPIHLAIGAVEGLVTAAVLCFIYQMRSEILESAMRDSSVNGIPVKKVLVILSLAAVLTGGFLSAYASANPDGLEWSIAGVTGEAELEGDSGLHAMIAGIQEKAALLPDYAFKAESAENSMFGDAAETVGTSVSGIAGGLVTMAAAVLTGALISRLKKRRNTEAAA
ncbi:energy-coupling factor ABC transporter permease [Anaerobium acetethylicum]|uniref:Cobalt/nickel transport system permease protein n=1 Tax=Anaerobium acetethylicum TaxID=1619234 RepID=A0A1D3TTZ8_9FIRM|nr:energy-coupling factor ABC transporter permease [Anaerobium acetethylicum]SCP97513.1 cobalt/nickel transport system permease protein [Anaerobium acetethylicum]